MPHSVVVGSTLPELPPWNSIYFSKYVKSKVQELHCLSFDCPVLARRGVRVVCDLTDADGGIREDLIYSASAIEFQVSVLGR